MTSKSAMGVDDGNLRPFSDEMIVSMHMYCISNVIVGKDGFQDDCL